MTDERPKPPVLTTRDCADLLGMSTGFIRSEIEDGRLQADIYTPADDTSGRRVYRVEWTAFMKYCERHWPAKHQKLAG